MMTTEQQIKMLQRRVFLSSCGMTLGATALTSMLQKDTLGAEKTPAVSNGIVKPFHVPPKAKRVIFLVQAGGPSHLETYDYKPELGKLDGKPMPESFTKGQPIAQLQGKKLNCLGPTIPFKKYGKSGQEISEALPEIGSIADDIAIIRSLTTHQINHDPAHTFMNTGTAISGRPCMGSWVLYGLGSESQNLPGFVVLVSKGGGQNQPLASRHWHSGFLPGRFQGVPFHSAGDPVHYVGRPPGVTDKDQKSIVDAVNQLNGIQNDQLNDPEIAARISQYELAYRMQSSVPELIDFKDEPQNILDMYGTKGGDGSFAGNCLLARRLAERGVRFIQLYHRGWDHHGGVQNGVKGVAKLVDKPCAALVKDLKQRGMLEDTLVVYTGEFGRTPMSQGNKGRDHHIKGFSMWMAGGGIKGGVSYGATDELGYNAVENVVQVRDLHATLLHQLGIDHNRLNYQFQGLDFKLTGVEPAKVIKPVLS